MHTYQRKQSKITQKNTDKYDPQKEINRASIIDLREKEIYELSKNSK